MHPNGVFAPMTSTFPPASALPGTSPLPPPPSPETAASSGAPVEWDWDIEHADRARENKADAAQPLHDAAVPFQVDRRVLKDVVREKTGAEVGRIKFISSGTFHKAYLITLVDGRELVARVARRFMPRLKTESEVATMAYLREQAGIPVPVIYHYDANPYNRLGGEYILMSKARGMPLSRVYHSLSNEEITRLFENLAAIVIPLFALRFSHLGSLYFGQPPAEQAARPPTSSTFAANGVPQNVFSVSPAIASPMTPTPAQNRLSSFPFIPLMSPPSTSTHTYTQPTPAIATPKPTTPSASDTQKPSSSKGTSSQKPIVTPAGSEFHMGPIVSWPFFGSGRGSLKHPSDIDRGPWRTTSSYLSACARREVDGVAREGRDEAASHPLSLDPGVVAASRHHHVSGIPDDESDESDEWGAQESEEEWDGAVRTGLYSDYRRMQRSTFLVAHMKQREERVKREMERWMRVMGRLIEIEQGAKVDAGGEAGGGPDGVGEGLVGGEEGEEFALDCHDISLENVFVDETNHTEITCIIDWESTTTRPLWACAHLPAFLQSSPFLARMFRETVVRVAARSAISSSRSSPNASSHSLNNLGNPPTLPSTCGGKPFSVVAREWLHHEAAGARLRLAHRCAEWDGWEEGLVESILGPEEGEDEWFADECVDACGGACGDDKCVVEVLEDHEEGVGPGPSLGKGVGVSGNGKGVNGAAADADADARGRTKTTSKRANVAVNGSAKANGVSNVNGFLKPSMNGNGNGTSLPLRSESAHSELSDLPENDDGVNGARAALDRRRGRAGKLALKREKEQEQTLDTTGDVCGGRGGELGRRLEAWLTNEGENGKARRISGEYGHEHGQGHGHERHASDADSEGGEDMVVGGGGEESD
ncbi:hypothetical protein CONPUDRAFT_84449 [Coniophora puteana RWD-64-598 SS2]|uniref:Altered inheritance of mitochondria protein 9, mitochondrial n=1 Tax=Coniophora puteana (strain RWD-64-598) TaxID=741705 RepID=A0A5M3MDM3_CONPW|nr:uncharacterized protein CONPUDRAFT_84449 [Coniophora puteana RWD-64-598 SS2]EIW77328.1 hypothetical protein CONPUDRAFT_84449 [Coniophora puteana RWD-64-598 SS2]